MSDSEQSPSSRRAVRRVKVTAGFSIVTGYTYADASIAPLISNLLFDGIPKTIVPTILLQRDVP